MSTDGDGDIDDMQISQTTTGKTAAFQTTPQQNIRVFLLKIMLNTNIPGMDATPFQFSMLSHPDLEKGKFSGTKYTLPYFTDTVKYPMDMLTPKLFSDRVDFFFNKTRFNKILRKTMVDYVDDTVDVITDDNEDDDTANQTQKQLEEERAAQLQDNADHNIKCMLVLLFPIADELGNVFKTSYDQFILNRPSTELYTLRNIDPVTFLNPSWFPLYNYFTGRKYEAPVTEVSYLKYNGTQYIINDVIWQNDLINHPVYRNFVSTYYDKLQEKRNSSRKVHTEFRERKEFFKSLVGKQIDEDPKTKQTKTTFASMIKTLISNIAEQINGRTQNSKFAIVQTSTSSQYNQKENTKRDIISKMVNYLGSVDDIIHGYDGELSGGTTNHTHTIITKKNIHRLLRGTEGEELLDKIVENIVNAYNDFTTYNERAEGAMKLTIKDSTRVLTELYNAAILLKTLKIVRDFSADKIRRLDLSEKNDDGSAKTKLELDILRVLNKNYTYYVSLNTAISGSLKDVVEPTRRSSNAKLQSFLKQLAIPTQADTDDSEMLIDIYDRYIASIRMRVKHDYIKKYMNVGVSTVVGESSDKSSKKLSSGENPEIYVYINLLKKDDYEKSEGRNCSLQDDRITNNLKQILYSNTMLDNSFPEMNIYRGFRLLGNDAPTNEKDKPGLGPVSTPASNPPKAEDKTGGRRRRTRNGPKRGRRHRRTRKR